MPKIKFKSKKKKKDSSLRSRTLSVNCPLGDNQYKIFKFLSHQSKNVFNYAMYIINVFHRYRNDIFKDVYQLLKDHYIKDITSLENHIYESIGSYMDHYTKIKKYLFANNKIIYSFVKDKLKDKLIVNNNFYSIKEKLIKQLEDSKLLEFNEDDKEEVFVGVLHNILFSFYCKNFYSTKDALLEHTPIGHKDKVFIEQVKKNDFLFKEKKINYRKSIIDYLQKNPDLNISWKTNQNYLTRYIYRNMPDFKLPSDVIGNIIKKTYESYQSYSAIKAKGRKANIPKYLPFNGNFILPYFARSFKEVKINDQSYLRLTVGKFIAENYNDIIGSDEYICLNRDATTAYKLYVHYSHLQINYDDIKINKKDHYLIGSSYIKKDDPNIINAYYLNIRKPFNIKDSIIKLIEINPLYNGYKFKINFVYDRKINKSNLKEKTISIDLGMTNLLTIYDPNGKPIIIKGSYLNGINKNYNKLIAYHQSILAKEDHNRKINKDKKIPEFNKKMYKKIISEIPNNMIEEEIGYRYTSRKIRNLYIRRSNKINDYFNKLVKFLTETYKDTTTIIIGYNKFWKQGTNMGRENNRKFNKIPYTRLINKLRDKLEMEGKKVELIHEAFTSKCDAMSGESIEFHKPYAGERIKRGLYRSKNGEIINADVNGAINIMRKWYKREDKKMKKLNRKEIFNPKVVSTREIIRKIIYEVELIRPVENAFNG